MVWVINQEKRTEKIFQYYHGKWKEGEPHGEGYHSS